MSHAVPPEPIVATLAGGVRAVALPMPWCRTVHVSVFVRTGSHNESRRDNGISHVVEHMAFKGTRTRDCQRINLDAERLGAEVNAHTDKDHTAFHIGGLPKDLPAFVPMLADIVLGSVFPAAELERERQVILHELTDYAEDPVSVAFQLFDRACYGLHPAGQPVIGNRGNLQRFTREDLLAYVARQYTAGNVVVAAAGALDADAFLRSVEAAFADVAPGAPHAVPPPAWHGGVKLRRMAGSALCQTVLGFAAPPAHGPAHAAWTVAAAVFGEGMSSPLVDAIRERRGLAYDIACSADLGPLAGQFVVDAATAPAQVEELGSEIGRLLQRHAEAVDAVALERARNQLSVRLLRGADDPVRRVESAALDVFALGRPRLPAETIDALHAVTAGQVREVFAGMLSGPAAIAFAGSVPARLRERAGHWLGAVAPAVPVGAIEDDVATAPDEPRRRQPAARR